VVTALTNGPDWEKTVLIINRDEWGGFFDHVVPPRVIAANSLDTDLVNGKALLGCRVPTIVVSPFSRGNPAKPRIDSLLYDHTSVLKLIEWRWGLQPLTPRDASKQVANLAHALNLNHVDATVPYLPVIPNPPLEPCFTNLGLTAHQTPVAGAQDQTMALANKVHNSGVDNETYDFYLLMKSERTSGWPIPEELRNK